MPNQAHPPLWAAFTDGSCWAKDRIGGWAWVGFDSEDREESDYGAADDTTISRMELVGPIKFLEWLYDEVRGPAIAYIYSDSEYVVLGARDPSRARNCHNDLWDRLDEAISRHYEVVFSHVKGHADSYYNDQADKLASKARKQLRNELQPTTRT